MKQIDASWELNINVAVVLQSQPWNVRHNRCIFRVTVPMLKISWTATWCKNSLLKHPDNVYIAFFVCPGLNSMLRCLQTLNRSTATFSVVKPSKTLEYGAGSHGLERPWTATWCKNSRKFAIKSPGQCIHSHFVCPGFNSVLRCLQTLNHSTAPFSLVKPSKTLKNGAGSHGLESPWTAT